MSEESDEQLISKRRAIQKIALLPSIPVVLQKIIETSSDPTASAHDLEKTIIKDQSISAAILKLANSAYYGYVRGVDDVERAVIIIGFNTAVSIAISVSVLKSLSDKMDSQEFSREDFWIHTIASGEAARILAQKMNYEFVSRAYIIGLIHDIGKVVLSFIDPAEFDDAVFEARAVGKPLYVCENEIFNFNHQDAGQWLGEKWQLPENIIAGIQYHHNIDSCPENFITEALIGHTANHIAKSAKFGNSGDELVPDLHPFVEKKLKLNSKKIEAAKKEMEKSREVIDNFLQAIQ